MKKNKQGYYKNRNGCFLLQYHLILIVKDRRPIITDNVKSYLEQYIDEYFKKQDIVILSMILYPNRIHIYFEAKPQLQLVNFINAFKTASSRMVCKKFTWSPNLWERSYFLCSINDETEKIANSYISGIIFSEHGLF